MATPAPALKTNRIGLERKIYEGSPSTLCQGCGHDSITRHIITAYYELGINPYKVAKMSGIGCSSKTPAYFLGTAYGFNAVHGRMPAIATGAGVANRELHVIGVSGDGDTASIGMGQFVHLVRRNMPMVYIIENNGVYGLTKGQFSATADVGSRLKTGETNMYKPIDCCSMAIDLGCDYVARAYSGDPRQLVPLIKGAICHGGTALIDVVSPCVTFNNHEGSTKSYKYVKENEWVLDLVDFVPSYDAQQVDYAEGETQRVQLPDGSSLILKKLPKDYNAGNRFDALRVLFEALEKKQMLTGLLYVNPDTPSLYEHLKMTKRPLAGIPIEELRPAESVLRQIMDELR
jgi:2-oxoglutarate ferredoxin oxidoreductase subunit beta